MPVDLTPGIGAVIKFHCPEFVELLDRANASSSHGGGELTPAIGLKSKRG